MKDYLKWIYFRIFIYDICRVKNENRLLGKDEKEQYKYYIHNYYKNTKYTKV